ncbi:MAG TPA: hypothetical protein VLT51_17705, partial [Anaerolineales bacterium]|nr:hypothetical protein [Anaerolineales bacterium]
MKKYLLLVTILLALSLLVMASPVTAARNEPIGDRINILAVYPTTFPAGAPFHIRHGWIQSSEDGAIGVF